MSPRHRQLLVAPEVLVRARSLCGAFPGGAVDAGLTEVTCHPLLYDRHEVILAEGAPTESFHPGETGLSALTPEAWAEVYAIFPDPRVGAAQPEADDPTRRSREVLAAVA